MAKLREFARPCFDARGAWIATPAPPETREWLWLSYAFLAGSAEEIDFASRLVMEAPEILSGHSGRPGRPYCVFASTHALHLLVAHGERFTPAARRRLEGWARRTITDDPGGARADLQFHGYNDNMPAKATLGLILGGERFGDPKAVEHGLWNLHQLRLMLARRGVISEHCSPTYSAIPLTIFAEIARLSVTAEARELAAAIHEHLWAEILAHYHAPTRSIAGPWSRAYATDSAGHLSNLHFLLWVVFGSDFVPDPVAELLPAEGRAPRNLVVHHSGDRFFVGANWALFADCEQQIPGHLLTWLEQRRYPFDFHATAERAEGFPEYPAGTVSIHSHQASTYALGTSNGDWVQQAEHWHLVYRRVEKARDFADIRHLTTRYLVDDELPGKPERSPLSNASGETDCTREHATHHTLQHKNIALVAARPLAALAGRAIRRMGLAIVLPEHLNAVEHVRFADGHFWLSDGPFMMAVRPLGVSRWSGNEPEATILRNGSYRFLFLPNYVGPERTFTPEELAATVNGFVSIAASREETSPEKFREAVLAASLRDTTWVNQRTIRWSGCGHTLELCCGIYSGGVRYATVDGLEVPLCAWSAAGLPHERLPVVHTAAQPNPYPFPYGAEADGWNEFPSRQMCHPDRVVAEAESACGSSV